MFYKVFKNKVKQIVEDVTGKFLWAEERTTSLDLKRDTK